MKAVDESLPSWRSPREEIYQADDQVPWGMSVVSRRLVPELDEYKATAKIRSRKRPGRVIPIIAMRAQELLNAFASTDEHLKPARRRL